MVIADLFPLMVRYKLFLQLKDSKERLDYTVNLNQNQENNPRLFFTPEAGEQLRSQLQNQSQRRINDQNLNYILNTWMKDIQQGYRETSIAIVLPLLSGANIEDLSEPGNHILPLLIDPDLSEIEPQNGALPALNF